MRPKRIPTITILGLLAFGAFLILTYNLRKRSTNLRSNLDLKRSVNNLVLLAENADLPVPPPSLAAVGDNTIASKDFRLDLSNETYYPTIADVFQKQTSVVPRFQDASWKLMRSSSPRLLYLSAVASPEQCDRLLNLAKSYLEKSRVVSHNEAEAVGSYRTSSGMFITQPDQVNDPANQRIRNVAASVAGVPLENIEATQILEYKPGQYYHPHMDYFARDFPEHLMRGGQRIATVLVWLNDCPQGGGTHFPIPDVRVPPKKGDAILFYDVDIRGVEDPASTHEGEPPAAGYSKYVAVMWIRQHTFI
eukprot:PhF_6_TR9744/c0_g1_i2/m.15010/K00472/P4HA; prolyl 4-hydroxylase